MVDEKETVEYWKDQHNRLWKFLEEMIGKLEKLRVKVDFLIDATKHDERLLLQHVIFKQLDEELKFVQGWVGHVLRKKKEG